MDVDLTTQNNVHVQQQQTQNTSSDVNWQQTFNVLVNSQDPALVDQAWSQINAARMAAVVTQGQAEMAVREARHEAQIHRNVVETQAHLHVQTVQHVAEQQVTRMSFESSERIRVLESQLASAHSHVVQLENKLLTSPPPRSESSIGGTSAQSKPEVILWPGVENPPISNENGEGSSASGNVVSAAALQQMSTDVVDMSLRHVHAKAPPVHPSSASGKAAAVSNVGVLGWTPVIPTVETNLGVATGAVKQHRPHRSPVKARSREASVRRSCVEYNIGTPRRDLKSSTDTYLFDPSLMKDNRVPRAPSSKRSMSSSRTHVFTCADGVVQTCKCGAKLPEDARFCHVCGHEWSLRHHKQHEQLNREIPRQPTEAVPASVPVESAAAGALSFVYLGQQGPYLLPAPKAVSGAELRPPPPPPAPRSVSASVPSLNIAYEKSKSSPPSMMFADLQSQAEMRTAQGGGGGGDGDGSDSSDSDASGNSNRGHDGRDEGCYGPSRSRFPPGGGGGGGPPDGGGGSTPPGSSHGGHSDLGMHGLDFSDMPDLVPEGLDLSWSVVDEDKVYKSRDLDKLGPLADLPTNAPSMRGWGISTLGKIAAIDCSAQDILTKWFLIALDVVGAATASLQCLHRNSQGLNRFDRWIGSLMTTTANLANPKFGLQFASYVEWCQKNGTAPRGRVLVAMVALRFRIDRQRGKSLNVIHLLNLPLVSYKISDIRSFCEKVKLCLVNIREDELKDPKLMFTWLFEKFRHWKVIERKIERIKESRESSHKRSWHFLWAVIHDALENTFEDENFSSISHALGQGTVSGAAAQTVRKDKKEKKAAAAAAASAKTAEDARVAAAVAKAKAKWGPPPKTGGGGGKGEGKNSMTQKDKKQKACRFEVAGGKGSCRKGSTCE